jgi:hypothetical protein
MQFTPATWTAYKTLSTDRPADAVPDIDNSWTPSRPPHGTPTCGLRRLFPNDLARAIDAYSCGANAAPTCGATYADDVLTRATAYRTAIGSATGQTYEGDIGTGIGVGIGVATALATTRQAIRVRHPRARHVRLFRPRHVRLPIRRHRPTRVHLHARQPRRGSSDRRHPTRTGDVVKLWNFQTARIAQPESTQVSFMRSQLREVPAAEPDHHFSGVGGIISTLAPMTSSAPKLSR